MWDADLMYKLCRHPNNFKSAADDSNTCLAQSDLFDVVTDPPTHPLIGSYIYFVSAAWV